MSEKKKIEKTIVGTLGALAAASAIVPAGVNAETNGANWSSFEPGYSGMPGAVARTQYKYRDVYYGGSCDAGWASDPGGVFKKQSSYTYSYTYTYSYWGECEDFSWIEWPGGGRGWSMYTKGCTKWSYATGWGSATCYIRPSGWGSWTDWSSGYAGSDYADRDYESRVAYSYPLVKTVDVNPVIDGVQQNSGVSGFTFDVYQNDSLIADNVQDYYNASFTLGSTIRVQANDVSGYTIINGGGTWTVNDNLGLSVPSWAKNVTASRITTVQDGSSGFYVYVYADTPPNTSINRVQFPTWTENAGQDDIQGNWTWDSGSSGSSGSWNIGGQTYNYRYYVSVASHKYEYGTYHVHVYGASDLGSWGYMTATDFNFRFNVHFNANGGSTPTASKVVTHGGTYGDLPTPTRTGYVFDGWYTSASGGSRVTSSTGVSITGDQTLYAHWTRSYNRYTVNCLVDSNGNLVQGSAQIGNASSYSYRSVQFDIPVEDTRAYNFCYSKGSPSKAISNHNGYSSGVYYWENGTWVKK